MQIGYARVSTDDQDTAVQVAALKTAVFYTTWVMHTRAVDPHVI